MKKILLALVLVLVLSLIWATDKYLPQLEIATGYAAKIACSCLHHGRDLATIKSKDLGDTPLDKISLDYDKDRATVTASMFGMKTKTAGYKNGLGCVLIQGIDDYKIKRLSANHGHTPKSSFLPQSTFAGGLSKELIDLKKLAFDSPGLWEKETTSLLIVYKDSLIAEFYSEGFDSETEILGWSMTKSVCNLLVGMMSKEGLIDVNQQSLYPEWENDDRKNISLANLLKMNSGLSWQEQYTDVSDITHGLFMEEDIVAYARKKPLDFPVGNTWEYSSGSTNLISGVIKRQFESYQDYLDFPHSKLFDKLDIADAEIEIDESGNYVMSSFMYAKPRDWAKLGLLYLHQGNWQGEQLIDSSYIKWSLMPSSADPNYGAHIWLNTNHKDYPSAPEDAYKFSGYDGQYVVTIPSKEIVIVRTGLSKGPPFDMDGVIKSVLFIMDENQ